MVLNKSPIPNRRVTPYPKVFENGDNHPGKIPSIIFKTIKTNNHGTRVMYKQMGNCFVPQIDFVNDILTIN